MRFQHNFGEFSHHEDDKVFCFDANFLSSHTPHSPFSNFFMPTIIFWMPASRERNIQTWSFPWAILIGFYINFVVFIVFLSLFTRFNDAKLYKQGCWNEIQCVFCCSVFTRHKIILTFFIMTHFWANKSSTCVGDQGEKMAKISPENREKLVKHEIFR